MPYCSECGTQLPPGARFCQTCGQPVATHASHEGHEGPSDEILGTVEMQKPGWRRGLLVHTRRGFIVAKIWGGYWRWVVPFLLFGILPGAVAASVIAIRIAGKSSKLKTLPPGELLRTNKENFEIPHSTVLGLEIRKGRLFRHTGRMIISTNQGQYRLSVWAGAQGGFGGASVRGEFDSFVQSVSSVLGSKVSTKGFD